MIEVSLTYPAPEGSRTVKIENSEFTIGRGAVDLRFDDNSMSRHHATVFREAERVWILDENSTNGTFVNGAPVAAAGTPLADGDSIRVGNETTFTIRIRAKQQVAATEASVNSSSAGAPGNSGYSGNSTVAASLNYLPFVVIGVAVVVIGLAAFVIGSQIVSGGAGGDVVVVTNKNSSDDDSNEANSDDDEDDDSNRRKTKPSPSPKSSNENANGDLSSPDSNLAGGDSSPPPKIVPRKTYAQMSEEEKRQFIQHESEIIARMLGNRTGEPITPEAVTRIKNFVDQYARRLSATRRDSCDGKTWVGSDLTSLLERGQRKAPTIIRAFNENGLAPQLGLYVAMIESEYCECLQSHTGPLGMFQFTFAAATDAGLKPVQGATPSSPDVRCKSEEAAPAAARYMRFLTGKIGTGPLSMPLAIAAFNSGGGALGKNLTTAMAAQASQERSFWTLIANYEKLSKQFQTENFKYVPKFFAAAIVGENPTVFGVNMPALASNTK